MSFNKKTQVVVGMQWGDEAKGKITQFLLPEYDFCVRYQGGNNAGHTVVSQGKKIVLQHLPVGVCFPNVQNVMCQGMVVNPKELTQELKNLAKSYFHRLKLTISKRAHVVMPYHIDLDVYNESKRTTPIGTTHKGIGPTYEDKCSRLGIRFCTFVNPYLFKKRLTEVLPVKNALLKSLNLPTYTVAQIMKLYGPSANFLRPYVGNTSVLLGEQLRSNNKILFEGAQGAMLCVENGTYPFVTSSSPTASSLPLATGVYFKELPKVLGVVKAYCSRVGSGPFPTEITDSVLQNTIRERGNEYGSVTKRPRRVGWFDAVMVTHAQRSNGASCLALTLLDVLDALDTIYVAHTYKLDSKTVHEVPSNAFLLTKVKVIYTKLAGWQTPTTHCKTWAELPLKARAYVRKIAELTGVCVQYVSVGPLPGQTIIVPKE